MPQHDYDLANATGANFRSDINSMAQAIVQTNAGSSAPGTTFANMPWYDQTTARLKFRDPGNTSWIMQRTVVVSGTTFYVSSAGNDNNSGLTSATAFKTASAAIALVANAVDVANGGVTIQLGDGIYGAITLPRITGGGVTLQGNMTNPGCCQVTGLLDINNAPWWSVQGFKFTNSAGSCIQLNEVGIGASNLEFGLAQVAHIRLNARSSIFIGSSIAITGSAACFLFLTGNAAASMVSRTITFSGVIGFSSAFIWAQGGGYAAVNGCTFNNVNSTGGKKFEARSNGTIDTAANSLGYLPGVTAGAQNSSGIYV